MSSVPRPTRSSLLIMLAMVGVAALAFVVPAGTTAPAQTSSVGACSPHAHCATEAAPATAVPCVHSASCGGGAPLTAGGGLVLTVLGAAIARTAPGLVRRFQPFDGPSTGRLTAVPIFRPPRLSF